MTETAVDGYDILMTSAGFEPGFRAGGPVRSVARIVDSASEHVRVSLLTSDRDLGSQVPYPGLSGRWVARGRSRVYYVDAGRLLAWWRVWRQLRRQHFDILYVNSLWNPLFTVLPILARAIGLIKANRILIAPRGELGPGALTLKARKKRIFMRACWSPLLKRTPVLWHASSELEAAEIREVCPWAQTVVNADQVALPRQAFLPTGPHEGAIRLVFISRITQKKNLLGVLQAMSGVSGALGLDIYGPLEDEAYWSRCKVAMASLPAQISVRYRGELEPDSVRTTFSRYDGFVFPTLGENFGHVIAESLSASCPVICSAATPWSGVLRSGGGVVLGQAAQAVPAQPQPPPPLTVELQRQATLSPQARYAARLQAADAYGRWRADAEHTNVLDAVCEDLANARAPATAPPGRAAAADDLPPVRWTRLLALLDQAFSGASNLLAVIVIARALTPSAFGVFSATYAALTLTVVLTRSLVGIRLVLSAAGAVEQRRRAASAAFTAVLLSAPLAALVVLGVYLAVSAPSSQPVSSGLVVATIVAVATPLVCAQDILRYAAFVQQRPYVALASDVTWFVIMALALLSGLARGAAPALASWLLACTAALVVSWVLLRPALDLQGALAALRPRFGSSEAAAIGSLAVSLASLLVVSIAALTIGPVAAGSLRGAASLMAPLNMAVAFVDLSLLGHLARRDSALDKEFCRRLGLGLVVCMAVWGGVLLSIPSSLGVHLMGQSWVGIEEILPWTVCEYLALMALTSAVLGLNVRGARKQQLAVRGFLAASAVLLGLLAAVILGRTSAISQALAAAATAAAVCAWLLFLRTDEARATA